MTAQICFRLGVRASERSALAQRMKPEKLFPMFLKLSARRCLVVGAGTIAESKIASLLEDGGRVRGVVPQAAPQGRARAQSNHINWRQILFQTGDLEEQFLIIAASTSTEPPPRLS